jgi:hypothetical protein
MLKTKQEANKPAKQQIMNNQSSFKYNIIDSDLEVRPTGFHPRYLDDQVWTYKDYKDTLPDPEDFLPDEGAVSCWMACNCKWFLVFQANGLQIKIWRINGAVVHDAYGAWMYQAQVPPAPQSSQISTTHGRRSLHDFVCQGAVGTGQVAQGERFFPLVIHFTRQGLAVFHNSNVTNAITCEFRQMQCEQVLVANMAVQTQIPSYGSNPARTPLLKYLDIGFSGVGMLRLDRIPGHIADQVHKYMF